jgi:hypothetical protein
LGKEIKLALVKVRVWGGKVGSNRWSESEWGLEGSILYMIMMMTCDGHEGVKINIYN